MKHWWLNCPYCNARISEGVGDGKFPKVFVPFFRCNICGELISTNSKEYINLTMEERLKIRATSTNCEYIEQSLDRTNNEKYINFLKFKHFNFYPINEQDYKKFKNVDFKKYENAASSQNATQSLYNVGILIKEEDFDKETGGLKKEKLIENQRNYEIDKKSNRAGVIAGWTVGILFAIIFGYTNPHSYSFLWGILLGVVSYFIVTIITRGLYEKEFHYAEDNTSKSKLKKLSDYSLCPKCGMQIFEDEVKCSNCGYLKEIKNANKDNIPENNIDLDLKEKSLREQKWKEQEQLDKFILNSNPNLKQVMEFSFEQISNVWFLIESELWEDTFKNSKMCLRCLTPELFFKMYHALKSNDLSLIKDNIYKEMPYFTHSLLTKMGLYIFQTGNNINVLKYIANSNEFIQYQTKARELLLEENVEA